MTITPRIIWQLSGSCTNECWYCLPKYRNNSEYKTIDEYLSVVDKLQNYGNRKNIPKFSWKFKGGEVLQFSNFNLVLAKVREKDSNITIETSGGQSWFDLMSVIDYLDKVILTHHHWQNTSVLDYIIDSCQEKNKKLKIIIPALPGRVRENKFLVQTFMEKGIEAELQLLNSTTGALLDNYSMLDLNIFYGRPDNWLPEDTPPPPVWIDPRIDNGDPKYTGKPCWAGVDWLYIDSRGYAKGSECNGRDIGNIFDSDWAPPDTAFACPMLFCHSQQDRDSIRIDA